MNTDQLTIDRINTGAHPFVQETLLCIYETASALITNPRVKLRFTCVQRSPQEQNRLYRQGRTAPGNIVTWVKAWGSYHQYGLAVDICLLIDRDGNGTFEQASWNVAKDWDGDGTADWMEVVQVFQNYGWDWGIITRSGKHIDKPHFQRTFGFTAAQLRKLPLCTQGFPLLPGANNIQKPA
jgi:peptidoglycan L-alanyl-D-glutamate endopeptidase CwlK